MTATTYQLAGAMTMTDEQILALRKASAVLCGTGHHDEAEVINSLLSASKPAVAQGMKVTDQGIQFGNAWYSHEKITGYTAEQLNAGDCRVTGRAYVAWLQETLAASPAVVLTDLDLAKIWAQADDTADERGAIAYARAVLAVSPAAGSE